MFEKKAKNLNTHNLYRFMEVKEKNGGRNLLCVQQIVYSKGQGLCGG
jgi:hypothetical protein